MFSVTYLGHQGWLVPGKQARILIDPVLTDEYNPGFRAAIYPPRNLELAKFRRSTRSSCHTGIPIT